MSPVVFAQEVAYCYPQHNRGLASLSLRIEPGERLLVARPSGCGKSTSARCLTGLIPHLYHGTLEGEVWLDGPRTTDAPLWQLAERAGLAFQNPASQMLAHSVEEEIVFGLENLGLVFQNADLQLFSASVRDEILFHVPDPDMELYEWLLAALGPARYEQVPPLLLSEGEKKRVALATVLMRRPRHSVLLVEPSLAPGRLFCLLGREEVMLSY